MKTADFFYELPDRLIAQKPLPSRDHSRLMVLNRSAGTITHTRFDRFPDFMDAGDLLILNDTRVIPARIWGKIRGRPIEFLFVKKRKETVWEVLCRPAKQVRVGESIQFSEDLSALVVECLEEGKRLLELHGRNLLDILWKSGFAPLPPYIKRKGNLHDMRQFDLERYQTVYADREGSIAAPTAGLHFTRATLDELRARGVHTEAVTLNVGLATFQPVRVANIEDHVMLEESFSISRRTAQAIASSKAEGRSVTAVGTTTVRALESSFSEGRVFPGSRTTDLFISPGYRFKVVDRLLTNFHLPESTLLMLVTAFAGQEFIMHAYRTAVEREYRFYSYGDCMLIL